MRIIYVGTLFRIKIFIESIFNNVCHFRQGYTTNKNKNQGQVFIVTTDANFSHIFGHNKVPHHVFNFIYNNAGEFTLLFS